MMSQSLMRGNFMGCGSHDLVPELVMKEKKDVGESALAS